MCTHVVVYMYLIFVMTGRNISNDGDKGVQICVSPTFIEPRAFSGNKSLVCINAECTLETLTFALTDAADIFVNCPCSPVGKTDPQIKSHVGTKMKEKSVVYELLKITSRKNDHCMN